MFQPPRCPNRSCPNHRRPFRGFFIRRGYYQPLCRARPVPRFRCRTCKRGFSRQTFRADYCDHKPYLNAQVFLSLATGLGLRQTARNVGLSLRCTELKFRKIARHLRRLNLNLRGPMTFDNELVFDEFETYEGRRNTRPLSVPLLIERDSHFVIWGEAAPIRPRGKMSAGREKALQADEARFGRRRDLSLRSIRRTLQRGKDVMKHHPLVHLLTDEKSVYPKLAKEVFGKDRVFVHRTNSKIARMTWNPLFPINHTEALVRDLLGRLRRESWLVSKKRRYLDLGLQLWMAYRNYVRKRFNYDEDSPASWMLLVSRRLKPGELLSWRQDWGKESLHPLGRGSETVSQMEKRAQAA